MSELQNQSKPKVTSTRGKVRKWFNTCTYESMNCIDVIKAQRICITSLHLVKVLTKLPD